MSTKLVVHFKLRKNEHSDWSNQIWETQMTNGARIRIDICNEECKVVIIHISEEKGKNLLFTIWELLAWYDGYFYKPIRYYVNGKRRKVVKLYPIKMYISDSKWIESAILLGRNERSFSENIIKKYENIRYVGRDKKSMNKSMFSSYFYLMSKAYKDINIEHRLELLMNVCDGFVLRFLNGNKHNNIGNIVKMVTNLDSRKYKEGANLLGISSSAALKALGYTRDELTHFDYNAGSLGTHISNPNSPTDHKIYVYAFYILEVALRVSLLNEIGFTVGDDVKEYIFDVNINWIKFVTFLDKIQIKQEENE